MADNAPTPPGSQTFIHAGALVLSYVMQAFWPALSPLMGIMRVFCLIGILTFGPLELYLLCRCQAG